MPLGVFAEVEGRAVKRLGNQEVLRNFFTCQGRIEESKRFDCSTFGIGAFISSGREGIALLHLLGFAWNF